MLDTTPPSAVKITNLGLIPGVPNKDKLFYYFTAQKVRISGVSSPNTIVYFQSTLSGHKYVVTLGAQSTFQLTIENPVLPRGPVTLIYYAVDTAGNESVRRELKLVIGNENFPFLLDANNGQLGKDEVINPSPETTSTPTPSQAPVETSMPTPADAIPQISTNNWWQQCITFLRSVLNWITHLFCGDAQDMSRGSAC